MSLFCRRHQRKGRLYSRLIFVSGFLAVATVGFSTLHAPAAVREYRRALSLHLLPQIICDLIQVDALLCHGVALPDGDGLILNRVIIDCEAEGRADLILACVALADILLDIEVYVPMLPQFQIQLLRDGDVIPRERPAEGSMTCGR